MTDTNQISIWVTVIAFALLSWQTLRFMRARNHLLFFIWPAFIYLIGPATMLMFVDQPVLNRYFDESRITAQTLLIFWYLLVFVVSDKAIGLSSALRQALNGAFLQRLSSSPIFPILFLVAVLAASSLQIYTLRETGTILSGVYILESGLDLPYWGFLAGLYEIIFLCFVLFLIGKRPTRSMWLLYIALYSFTTILRVLGGTRLVLIKEFAFMIIFFYLRGTITTRKLMIVGAVIVGVGSGVGLLRAGGGGDAVGLLGPVYGLVMESALNTLTLGIADAVNQSGAVARDSSTFASIGFFVLSALPSFLRFGYSEADIAALSPYNLALTSFDVSSPVGGMSGFATINYLSSYPYVFILAMVVLFSLWFKNLRNGPFKQIFGLVAMTNAVHFWRDPADIAFKLLIQGLIVCALLYVFPPRRLRVKKKEQPPAAPMPTPGPAIDALPSA